MQRFKSEDEITKQVFSLNCNTGLARVVKTIKIEPRSSANVKVFISNLDKQQDILLEPVPQLPELGIAGAKCLVNLSKTKQTYMQVINPNDNPVVLQSNIVIASASLVDITQVMTLESSLKEQTKPKPNLDQGKSENLLTFNIENSDLDENQKELLSTFFNIIVQFLQLIYQN